MKVILNADDFGLSKGINLGIMEAYHNGVVRSAAIMPNMPFFNHAVEIYKNCPGLGIGVELTLTRGEPLIKTHKTMVEKDNTFKSHSRFFTSAYRMDLEEVMTEFVAQIDKVLDAGIQITHIDSFQHVHELEVFEYLMVDLYHRYKVPIRGINDRHINRFKKYGIKTCDDFSAQFFGDAATEDMLKDIVENSARQSIDIMCHPGYVDYELYQGSGYALKRIDELHILTSDSIKAFFCDPKFELCNYSEI